MSVYSFFGGSGGGGGGGGGVRVLGRIFWVRLLLMRVGVVSETRSHNDVLCLPINK